MFHVKRLLPLKKTALYSPRFKENFFEDDQKISKKIARRTRLRDFLYNGA